jgi:hypothetical protein
MAIPPPSDNAAFNNLLARIEDSYSDNDPDGHNADGPLAEIKDALALLWKHVGGEITPTWREKMEGKQGW